MSQPTSLASKVVSRSVLIVVIVISTLGILATLLYGAMTQDSLKYGSTCTDIRVSGSLPPLPQPDFKGLDARYTYVELCAPANRSGAGLQMADALIPFLVAGLTCFVLLVLAVQMLRRKPFGLGVAISMFTVAAVCIGSGFARPAIKARAEELLVASLGLPTIPWRHGVWLLPDSPDWTYSDWPFIMIGLLIALGGWLVLRARQLRLDLEGTI